MDMRRGAPPFDFRRNAGGRAKSRKLFANTQRHRTAQCGAVKFAGNKQSTGNFLQSFLADLGAVYK